MLNNKQCDLMYSTRGNGHDGAHYCHRGITFDSISLEGGMDIFNAVVNNQAGDYLLQDQGKSEKRRARAGGHSNNQQCMRQPGKC